MNDIRPLPARIRQLASSNGVSSVAQVERLAYFVEKALRIRALASGCPWWL